MWPFTPRPVTRRIIGRITSAEGGCGPYRHPQSPEGTSRAERELSEAEKDLIVPRWRRQRH